MYIFKFNLTKLSEKRACAILDEMDKKRGGAIGSFSGSVGNDYYLGLLDLVDATEFRRRLRAIGVEFAEPNEFPAEIRKSPSFSVAMSMLGLG